MDGGYVVLGGYTGKANRGTEAIAISTATMFRKHGVKVALPLVNDEERKVSRFSAYYDQWIKCYSVDNRVLQLFSAGWNKVFHNTYAISRYILNDILKESKNGLLVHIGGDTYCYGNSLENNALVYWAKKKGIPIILWGTSIERESLDDRPTLSTLKKYDRIYVRESLSLDLFRKYGFSEVTVKTADPAFTLEPQRLVVDETWWGKNVVGINLSPFAMNENQDKMIVINGCIRIIQKILNETDWNIALIPHVWLNEKQGDYEPLNILKQYFIENERVKLISGDYNCCQLKYLISRCYAFLATRTHASIAAYSSLVPTLGLGYSIKSRGIAQDLFGDSKGYVLPVQQLHDSNEVYSEFIRIIERHDAIRKHLKQVIPSYQNLALSAVEDAMKYVARRL